VVLPLLVESVKNRIDDSLHAGQFIEQDHGPGAPSNFHEATLDGVGGAQLAPQRLREIEERQQVRQIALEPFHQSRVESAPVKTESLEGPASGTPTDEGRFLHFIRQNAARTSILSDGSELDSNESV